MYSQHLAIAQSKGFSDPKPLIPVHQEPFRVTDAIVPSIPMDRKEFDEDREQKMAYRPASIDRQTNRHKCSEDLEAA